MMLVFPPFMQEHQVQVDALEEQLKQSKEEIAKLVSDLEKARERIDQSELECDQLEEKICELTTQVETFKTAMSKTKQRASSQPPLLPPQPPPPPSIPEDEGEEDAPPATPAGQAASEDAAREGRESSATSNTTGTRPRVLNIDTGVAVAPIAIPKALPSFQSAASDSSTNSNQLLADQFVVVKQLTNDFQAERMRSLQLIAQLQDELSDCHSVIDKLQDQERLLKSAVRELEER